MEYLTKEEYKEALLSCGLRKGDILYCQTDLSLLGMPEQVVTLEEFCQFFIDGIREIIGHEGTLVIPTMTTQVGRSHENFDPQSTLSNYGTLPRHVSTHPDFIRSLNPLISVAAIGKYANEICGPCSAHNYNCFSPFEKMHRLGAKNIFLGAEVEKSIQFAHYCEFISGVPYLYNKILDKRPCLNGVISGHLTTASVRFMNCEYQADYSRLVEQLRNKKALMSVKLKNKKRAVFSVVSVPDIVNTALEALDQDPFFLLDRTPIMQYGEVPIDGVQDAQSMDIRDPELQGLSDLDKLALKLKLYSPRLSQWLDLLFQKSQDKDMVLSAVSFLMNRSSAYLKEFAWAFNETMHQLQLTADALTHDAHQGIENIFEHRNKNDFSYVLSRFLFEPYANKYIFLLSYYFAPFKTLRQNVLYVGSRSILTSLYFSRFSHINGKFNCVSHIESIQPHDTRYTDMIIESIQGFKADLSDFPAHWLVKGGRLILDLPLSPDEMKCESFRKIEYSIRNRITHNELMIQQLCFWGNKKMSTVILQKK